MKIATKQGLWIKLYSSIKVRKVSMRGIKLESNRFFPDLNWKRNRPIQVRSHLYFHYSEFLFRRNIYILQPAETFTNLTSSFNVSKYRMSTSNMNSSKNQYKPIISKQNTTAHILFTIGFQEVWQVAAVHQCSTVVIVFLSNLGILLLMSIHQ